MKKLTALVTGASSGIGEQIALSLQSAGYQVYAGARRTDRLKHLESHGIKTIGLDVTEENSIQQAVNQIEKQAGMIDLLINNAGYGSYGAFEDIPMSEAKNQFEVNVFGLARLTQLVIPKMRAHRHGTIINISSIGGKFGESFGVWYHATKYAVEGLTDSLALELAPFGIKVIAIEPGAIKTEWSTIAAENLIKNSANGAYAESAQKKAAIMKRFNQMSLASEPTVIAKGILKILKKKNPKFRYAIGGGAKPLMLFRKLTSDRVFYYLLSKII
ncbi:SDR family NAD(P)-dependent oxidoreductase [Candidatus Peregrinibacteria bacterium]|nr:SDR family NAD(P)-dependent oxidoreductase [Candidatus Peregrinibacteria bacterium]